MLYPVSSRWPRHVIIPALTYGLFSVLTLFPAGSALCLPSSATIPGTALQDAFRQKGQETDRLRAWQNLTAPQDPQLPAQDYANFLRYPERWPLQKRIQWRFQNALSRETENTTLARLCPLYPLDLYSAFLACSPYLPHPAQTARHLWVNNLINDNDRESFLADYGAILSSSDEWARYVTLEKSGLKNAARHQISRLASAQTPLANARFSARFYQDDAKDLFDSLPVAQQHDEELLLLQLRALRHSQHYDEARDFWQHYESFLPRLSPSWIGERLALARALLRRNTGQEIDSSDRDFALKLTDLPPLGGDITMQASLQEAALLKGYITLIYLHQSQTAFTIFQFWFQSPHLERRAEALYWAGRCLEHEGTGQKFLTQAATLPTTFYGQMALARLVHSPFLSDAARSPAFISGLRARLQALPPLSATAAALQDSDLANAAQNLLMQGERENALLFLSFLTGNPSVRNSEDANIALALMGQTADLPKISILAARNLAQMGKILYPVGYPIPYNLSDYPDNPLLNILPDGLLPALVRQESSGDPNVISPAHAVGLTQILPATAQHVIQRNHLSVSSTSSVHSLNNPRLNLLLGGLYLQNLWQKFDHSLLLTLAAYNAGPGRARQWADDLSASPVSGASSQDSLTQQEEQALNWLITLPYRETRTYIAHISTDMSLYALTSAR